MIVAQHEIGELLYGNLFETIIDVFVGGIMSEALFGTMLGIMVVVPLWILSDDLALPTVIVILFGGMAATFLPGDYAQVASYIIIVGLASAIIEIGRRYFL